MKGAQKDMLEPARQETDLPTRIARSLLAFIRTEKLQSGDRLPSQTILAEHLNVSRTSLREALARLQTEGLIQQVHGVGTFVAQDPQTIESSADLTLSITEMLEAQGIEPGTPEVELTRIPVHEAPPRVGRALGLEPDDDIYCLTRVRTADGIPFAYVISYIVSDLPNFSTDPEDYRGSVYAYLQANCGEFITDADSEIEARITDEFLCGKLGTPAGSPLLTLQLCHYNANRRALIYSIEYFIQNRMHLKIRRQRSGHHFFKEEN
ncbi:MAG: GntR family transcriptional regulator [Anaerolineales bacterium]|nr:GntR family transcriptional regulator [Anaerolineales bacterium]